LNRGVLVLSHVKGGESTTDRAALRGLAGWMSRSLDAMRAELQCVDSGSLDVLLYDTDDVAASTPRQLEAERPR
jgi:hypothetical protein